MPFLFRATPRQDLAGRSLRSEANLTAAGHSGDTPDQTPDATKTRNALHSILNQGNMRRVSWSFDEVPSLVDQVGAEEVGRLYAVRTREELDDIQACRVRTIYEQDNDPLGWIDDAVAFNDFVDPEVRLRMVIAAIDEAEDDDVLWCIGDQPVAHLAAVRGFALRLHQARTTNPKVERLFRLMQDYFRNVEESPDAGWWDDGGYSLGD